jgi:hypothetical protein
MRARLLLRSAAAAGVILILAAVAGGESVGVRVFQLKYKRVEEATLLVRPLLSDTGSILLQPRLNTLTVTDRESSLNTVARALSQFDLPPRGFSIAVKMVRAQADAPAGDLGKEIGGIGNKLREVFRFNDYSLIDSAILRGAEGDQLSYLLGGEYRLVFRIDPMGVGSTLRFSQFALARERTDEKGRRITSPLFRTTLNVLLNQTVVIGASKEEKSKKALILILFAQETPRPSTEKGPAGQSKAEVRP